MNTPARFILLVLVVLVAAAALLGLRSDEWLAILQDEGKQGRIISLLEPRLTHSPDDPGLLAKLGRAYADRRVYDRAIELMKRYIELQPEDADGYARLSEIYKNTGDLAAQIQMLERSVAIAPKLARALELAALYRRAQRAEDELAVLSEREHDLKVESGFLLRLAELRDGTGNRVEAITALMRPEVLSDPPRAAQQAEARLFLARLLFEVGQNAEAVRLGQQWILQWREPWLANRLLQTAALHAPAADAARIADAVVASHPEIRFFVVNRLASEGAKPVARHLLATWVDANLSPSMNEIAAFLSSCRDRDELSVAWQAFGVMLGRKQSIEFVTLFTKALVGNFGIGALAPFWASLPPEVIRQHPLLAAQLAFHQSDAKLTSRLLLNVHVASLSASDRRIWIELLTAATSPAVAFTILSERRRRGDLPDDLLAQYARLAGGLGQ